MKDRINEPTKILETKGAFLNFILIVEKQFVVQCQNF